MAKTEAEEPEPKKRKVHKPPPRRSAPFPASNKVKEAAQTTNLTVPEAKASGISFKIQQAKSFAIAQAQQDGCTGSFKTFDSEHGNFLIPVVPSRAELTR